MSSLEFQQEMSICGDGTLKQKNQEHSDCSHHNNTQLGGWLSTRDADEEKHRR